MSTIDVLLRRVLRRIKDALPGHTVASRLRKQSATWRHLPPAQRAAAYVQFYRTQQELLRIHIEQKIAPKIVNLLLALICSELGILIGLMVACGVLVLLFQE